MCETGTLSYCNPDSGSRIYSDATAARTGNVSLKAQLVTLVLGPAFITADVSIKSLLFFCYILRCILHSRHEQCDLEREGADRI